MSIPVLQSRELIALLSLSSWCLLIVVCLFLTLPWVCLQFLIVFPDHTQYYFLLKQKVMHMKLLSGHVWYVSLTLKVPITTAADGKFCHIFPNFRKK